MSGLTMRSAVLLVALTAVAFGAPHPPVKALADGPPAVRAAKPAQNENVSFENFAESLQRKKPANSIVAAAAAVAARDASKVNADSNVRVSAADAGAARAVEEDTQAKDSAALRDELMARVKTLEKSNAELTDLVEKELEHEESLSQKLDAERDRASSVASSMREQAKEREQLSHRLEEVRKQAADPALSNWMRKRVENAGALIDSADSGRVLGNQVASAYDEAKHSVEYLEKTLESTVQQRFTSSRGFSVLLSMTIMLLPALTTGWAVSRISKIVTYPQYVLLIHIFNLVTLSVLIVESILLSSDPLVKVHLGTPHYYLLGVILGTAQVVIVMYMMLYTCASGRKGTGETRVFSIQALCYLFMCIHAAAVIHPKVVSVKNADGAALVSNISSYVMYFILTFFLMVQVMALARRRKSADIAKSDATRVKGMVDRIDDSIRGTQNLRPSYMPGGVGRRTNSKQGLNGGSSPVKGR